MFYPNCNIDDGASSLDEALTMLKIAVDNGVTTQVLTPHIHMGRFNNTKQQLEQAFIQFKEEVDKENIQIKLLLGAELRIGPEIMTMVSSNQIPWLGEYQDQKTFLLEFPRNDIPYGSDNLVRWVLSNKYLPIIVHPERNSTFMNHPEKLQVFIDLGCPIQITSCSLTGKFGSDVQHFAEQLLIDEKVSAIASDCHNLKGRKPDILVGFEHAKALIGEQQASTLVNLIPNSLIHNNKFQ
ncbi:tyrosine protein phosphatase [Colwellia sp. MSW7]|uniref:protein-tyrosine-phosphatase n=1 Tax=Colwellia maritima TaxID=2912588 RepID=A0ABS9X2T6_9GAMM|nr:CpsB/CapC family capsule biosynthesis tyrosine phosphatase [Colwellia maritima]MCI2283781.1 tyrosine protein phosphatase [Colwellia maritima]